MEKTGFRKPNFTPTEISGAAGNSLFFFQTVGKSKPPCRSCLF